MEGDKTIADESKRKIQRRKEECFQFPALRRLRSRRHLSAPLRRHRPRRRAPRKEDRTRN